MNWIKGFAFGGIFVSGALFLAGCGSSQTATPEALQDADLAYLNAEVYVCESGEEVHAAYPDIDTAVIQYRGDTHTLQIAVSADGARYINDDLQWWVKGAGSNAEGILFDGADGTYEDALEVNCSPE